MIVSKASCIRGRLLSLTLRRSFCYAYHPMVMPPMSCRGVSSWSSGLWPMAIFFSWIFRRSFRSTRCPTGAAGGMVYIYHRVDYPLMELYQLFPTLLFQFDHDIGQTVDLLLQFAQKYDRISQNELKEIEEVKDHEVCDRRHKILV